MENWEACVFFCFSYFPCCYQASGRGRVYDSTSATKKSILLPKKLPHTLIQCEPRQRVDHKAYQYSAVFGENQEESNQLHLRKVPSVYSTCFKMFF